jgi:hypothetical protein
LDHHARAADLSATCRSSQAAGDQNPPLRPAAFIERAASDPVDADEVFGAAGDESFEIGDHQDAAPQLDDPCCLPLGEGPRHAFFGSAQPGSKVGLGRLDAQSDATVDGDAVQAHTGKQQIGQALVDGEKRQRALVLGGDEDTGAGVEHRLHEQGPLLLHRLEGLRGIRTVNERSTARQSSM